MKPPPPDWIPTRVVVDDSVIASDDPQKIIDPVWWRADFYQSVETLEETLAPFSWPQRLVWAVLWFDAEVMNGGLDQFFSNSTGMIWPEAVEGFDAIGRQDLSSIVREAAARFPLPPSRDGHERNKAMDEMAEGALDDLTSRYYQTADDGYLHEHILAYIRRHPDAFYFDGVIHAPPPLSEA